MQFLNVFSFQSCSHFFIQNSERIEFLSARSLAASFAPLLFVLLFLFIVSLKAFFQFFFLFQAACPAMPQPSVVGVQI
jgi:hypothetical protein